MRKNRKRTCQLGVPIDNAIGRCMLHNAMLSPRQAKNRECLKKHCRHLKPFKQHPFWDWHTRWWEDKDAPCD